MSHRPPPQYWHSNLGGVVLYAEVRDRIRNIVKSFHGSSIDPILDDHALERSARHNRLAYDVMRPDQRISIRIHSSDQRVIVHRPVIAAVHVIFARPDHFDWHAGSFGHVDSFADKIRRRIRAATKTTAQQRSVNLHLLRLQSGDASCSHTINGLELRARPDLASIS